jgi:hypothetical protein
MHFDKANIRTVFIIVHSRIFNTKMFLLGLFLLIVQTFFAQTSGGNIGIGFSTNGPFDVPLAQMKSKNVFILKNWDIVPELLDQMEITYPQV